MAEMWLPPPLPPLLGVVEASNAEGGIVATPAPALARVGEGEEAGEARSKVAVATKTTRQKDSSKLLKHLPLHCRKKSSALGCLRHSSEKEIGGSRETCSMNDAQRIGDSKGSAGG